MCCIYHVLFCDRVFKRNPVRSGMALRAAKNVSLSFWALINGAPLFSTFCPDFRERPKWSEEEEDLFAAISRHPYLQGGRVGTLPIKPHVLLACNDPRLLNLTLIDRNWYIDSCEILLALYLLTTYNRIDNFKWVKMSVKIHSNMATLSSLQVVCCMSLQYDLS